MIDLSRIKEKLHEKPVAICGWGKSAHAVFDACRTAEIDTAVWDDKPEQRRAAEEAGAVLRDLTSDDMKKYAFLCLSPGVPLTHPKPHAAVTRAREAGIAVIGDIEMFHMAKPRARTICITGTNGKSTTTALIGHILQNAKIPSAVGGNIGTAAMTLPDLGEDAVYVLELSSYQTDLLKDFRPDIGVLVNLAPDHLDRHGGMEGYIAAKERMFDGAGTAIISMDDPHCDSLYSRVKEKGQRKMIPVSCLRPMMRGVFASSEGVLFDGKESILNLETCPALKGQHNWQNAAMAYAACVQAGADRARIISGLQSFPGLEHRQKIITALNGVTYINDSKATNDQAAAVALKTYPSIYWIAGGKPKDGGYADCEKYLGNVRHAFLIGEAEESMAAWLAGKNVEHSRCGNLATAAVAAHRLAQKERISKAVVLLSPACASFDQFKSFEHRGESFTDLVLRLTKKDKNLQRADFEKAGAT